MDSIKTLLGYVQSGFFILLMLTILVAVHEFGHFWFARMLGMHVEAFAVMMGGKRQPGLESRLNVPQLPSRTVWFAALIVATTTAFAGLEQWNVLYYLGMIVLALPIPIWVVTRIGALYHVAPEESLKSLLKTYAVGLVLLILGTKFRTPDVTIVLGVMLASGIVGILLCYYQPALNKSEDTPQGHAEIKIGTETVPVRYRPLLARTDRHGTEFSLLLLPLGGFASIRGMHPKEDGSEVKIDRGFYSRGALARIAVLFAGPLFSVLLGIVILATTYKMGGVPTTIPAVESFSDRSRAGIAGVMPNDKVVELNGLAVTSIDKVIDAMHDNNGERVKLVVERKGQRLAFDILPYLNPTPEQEYTKEGLATGKEKRYYKLGIGFKPSFRPAAWGESVQMAVAKPFEMVSGLFSVVKRPDLATENLGGVVSMAKTVNTVKEAGILPLLQIAGLISMSLGVMNLLPIHPLDGGQIVVAVLELFRGRRLSLKTQGRISGIGLMLVLALSALVLMADLGRIGK
ncbi:MAG: site-2 protease family protein [Armatimonadetes bacterium]|nr:site-2 protease family protein [Armatimonadota bacterium]